VLSDQRIGIVGHTAIGKRTFRNNYILFSGITQNLGILLWESYLFVIFVVSDSLFIPTMAPTNKKMLVCSMRRTTRECMHDDRTGISALTKMPRNNNLFLQPFLLPHAIN
jgi:hypothetical protein